jgi:hypothetical protein
MPIFFQVLLLPGISMSEELQNYNFPTYPAEPLVKHASRLDIELFKGLFAIS